MGYTLRRAVLGVPQTQARTQGTKCVEAQHKWTHNTHTIPTHTTHTTCQCLPRGAQLPPALSSSFALPHAEPTRGTPRAEPQTLTTPSHTPPQPTPHTACPSLRPAAPQAHAHCPATHSYFPKSLPQRGPREALESADVFLWLVHREEE